MKISATIAVLLLPFWLVCQNISKVEFFEGNVIDLQEQARNYGKMTLVYFHASWCMPCKWMDENTFTNTSLAKYINESYFPIRVNIDDPEGKIDQERYEVTLIPTILLFGHDGQLVARYEEALNPTHLSRVLQKHYKPGQPAISTAFKEEMSDEPVMTTIAPPQPLNLYYPPLIPEELETEEPPAQIIDQPEEESLEVLHTDNATSMLTSYYSIQLGAFSSIDNAKDKLSHLKTKIDNKIYIKNTVINGVNFYRLLTGQYEHEEPAKLAQLHLLKRGINGFVKKFDN